MILRHACFSVTFLHIFRTPFHKNTSGGLLLDINIDENHNVVNRRSSSSRGNVSAVNKHRGIFARGEGRELEGEGEECWNRCQPLQIHNEFEWKNKGRNEDRKFQFTADFGVQNVPVDPSNTVAVFKMFYLISWEMVLSSLHINV